jgi:hypothetical protein
MAPQLKISQTFDAHCLSISFDGCFTIDIHQFLQGEFVRYT